MEDSKWQLIDLIVVYVPTKRIHPEFNEGLSEIS